jgi:prepilin-type N-terminal cleavage/methylation domain-containing protein
MMFRNREGFTLIELLIVVVIIGILAAIALPKFGQTREAAYYTTLKADLNNLRSAQEMYYQTVGDFDYASTIDALEFNPSAGVTLSDIATDGQAWGASATHSALGENEGCAIEFGEGDPGVSTPGGVAIDDDLMGAPVCDDNPPEDAN